MRAYRVIGAVLGLGLVGRLIWSVRGLPSAGVRSLGTTVVIEVGETFGPASPSASARVGLTPDQVLRRYAQLGGGKLTHPFGNTTVYLGSLTFNGQKYLVYGFATPSGCAYSGLKPPPPGPCTEWRFIDAELGVLIDQTSSPTSGIL